MGIIDLDDKRVKDSGNGRGLPENSPVDAERVPEVTSVGDGRVANSATIPPTNLRPWKTYLLDTTSSESDVESSKGKRKAKRSPRSGDQSQKQKVKRKKWRDRKEQQAKLAGTKIPPTVTLETGSDSSSATESVGDSIVNSQSEPPNKEKDNQTFEQAHENILKLLEKVGNKRSTNVNDRRKFAELIHVMTKAHKAALDEIRGLKAANFIWEELFREQAEEQESQTKSDRESSPGFKSNFARNLEKSNLPDAKEDPTPEGTPRREVVSPSTEVGGKEKGTGAPESNVERRLVPYTGPKGPVTARSTPNPTTEESAPTRLATPLDKKRGAADRIGRRKPQMMQGPEGPRPTTGAQPHRQSSVESGASELSLDMEGVSQPLLGSGGLRKPADNQLERRLQEYEKILLQKVSENINQQTQYINVVLMKQKEYIEAVMEKIMTKSAGKQPDEKVGVSPNTLNRIAENITGKTEEPVEVEMSAVQVIPLSNLEGLPANQLNLMQELQQATVQNECQSGPVVINDQPGLTKRQRKSAKEKLRKKAKAEAVGKTAQPEPKKTNKKWTEVLGRKARKATEPSDPPKSQPRNRGGGGYKGPGSEYRETSARHTTSSAPLIHVVTVRSTKGDGADAIKDKLTNAIRPTKSGLSIVSWQRAMYGGIRVELASKSQAETFVAKVNAIPTLSAVHQQPKLPRLVFRGVGKDAADEDVLTAISNRVGHSTGARVLKSFSLSKKASTRNVVVEVTPGLRSEMTRFGRRWQVGWQAAEVGDFNQLTQCFNCQLYGHVSKECKAPTRCRWCAEAGHSGDQCPGWDNQHHFVPACFGCQKHKLRGPPHDAGDRNRCGYYRMKFEAHKESIGLGDGHRTGR